MDTLRLFRIDDDIYDHHSSPLSTDTQSTWTWHLPAHLRRSHISNNKEEMDKQKSNSERPCEKETEDENKVSGFPL